MCLSGCQTYWLLREGISQLHKCALSICFVCWFRFAFCKNCTCLRWVDGLAKDANIVNNRQSGQSFISSTKPARAVKKGYLKGHDYVQHVPMKYWDGISRWLLHICEVLTTNRPNSACCWSREQTPTKHAGFDHFITVCNDHAAKDRHAGRPSKEEIHKYEQSTKSWQQKHTKRKKKPNKSVSTTTYKMMRGVQTLQTTAAQIKMLEHAMDKW